MLHNPFEASSNMEKNITFLPLFALSVRLYFCLATLAVSATAHHLLVSLLTAPCFPSLLSSRHSSMSKTAEHILRNKTVKE